MHALLLSDGETAGYFSELAEIRAMLAFEAALARAEGRVGVIPAAAAGRIAAIADTLDIPPAALAAATVADGVPVLALVAALRKAVGLEAADFVHWGATSQDVVDSGLVLRLRPVLALFDGRLARLAERLEVLAGAHAGTVMAARTRGQQAVPTTFGFKVAGWREPLLRHRARLAELTPRLLVLSFGGAAGTLAALGDKADAVEAALAAELDLAVPPLPWHAQRDTLAELAAWLALVTGSLGKIGGDVQLLAQSEVGEVRPAGGGSSTMPHKNNPVDAELLVTLARFTAGLSALMQQTVVHAQERDGSAWMLEWLSLPQMVLAAGVALAKASALLDGLAVDADRMAANLTAAGGLALAEAAVFALAAHMPRAEAEALVRAASREAAADGRPLMAVLAARTAAPVDWRRLSDPASALGRAASGKLREGKR